MLRKLLRRIRMQPFGFRVRPGKGCGDLLAGSAETGVVGLRRFTQRCGHPRGQAVDRRIIPGLQRTPGKLQRPDKVAVLQPLEHAVLSALPGRHGGGVRPIHLVQRADSLLRQIALDRALLRHLLNVRLLRVRDFHRQGVGTDALCGCAVVPLGPGLDGRLLFAGQELAHVGLGHLRVQVQRLLEEISRALPLAVRQGHFAPLDQRGQAGVRHRRGGRGLLHDYLRLHRRLLRVQHLADASQQILHEADFAHVLALQGRQLVGQVVGIHVPVAGDQQPLAILRHQGQVAAPLVLHPHGIEVLRLAADDHHHPRGIQRSEDVGLVLLAQLVLQRDAAEEHLVPLLRQPVVDLLRPLGIPRALAVFIRLLVADEHVVGLLAGGNGQDALLNLRDLRSLRLVQAAALRVRRVLQRREVVRVREDRRHLHPVAGGHAPARGGILHVLDAVAADHRAPVCFGVGIVLLQQLFVGGKGLVKLALAAEMVRPVVAVQLRLVLRLGDGRGAAAVFAGAVGCAGGEGDVPAAHFAFDNHALSSIRCSGAAIFLSVSAEREGFCGRADGGKGRKPQNFVPVYHYHSGVSSL